MWVIKSAMAIQCVPRGVHERDEVYRAVDAAIDVLDASGLPYTVGAMETVVEGPLDQLIELAQKAHEAVLEHGGGRAMTYIKLVSAPDLQPADEKLAKFRTKGH